MRILRTLLQTFALLSLLAGCSCGHEDLNPYGKNFPPGETPPGDDHGNIHPPSADQGERTPMNLNPGD